MVAITATETRGKIPEIGALGFEVAETRTGNCDGEEDDVSLEVGCKVRIIRVVCNNFGNGSCEVCWSLVTAERS
jgi:hypothetical protein